MDDRERPEGADDRPADAGPDDAPLDAPAPPPVYAPYAFRPADLSPLSPETPAAPAPAPEPPAASSPADQPRVAEAIEWPSGNPALPRRPTAEAHAGSVLSKVGEELVAWFKTLVSAAVYATLIVTFGFQVARVEGLSMAPTLEDQDRLIVNKLAYRLSEPQAGDIVMLYYPLDPSKSFVKRVIGEPGDVVKSINGQVYRNDVPLDDRFIPDEYRSDDTWGPETIPEGYFFVMGDHRNNSSDSRTWKYVPRRYIIGRVQLRWWPIDEMKVF